MLSVVVSGFGSDYWFGLRLTCNDIQHVECILLDFNKFLRSCTPMICTGVVTYFESLFWDLVSMYRFSLLLALFALLGWDSVAAFIIL